MAINLNYSKKPELQLHRRVSRELIQMYGTNVQFIFTEGELGSFQDFLRLQTLDTFQKYEFPVLLSEKTGYGNPTLNFNQFGLFSEDTMEVYVHIDDLDFLKENDEVHPKYLITNLLVFPNGKVFEITDCELWVEGFANIFAYSDVSYAYKLSLKVYSFDRKAYHEKEELPIMGLEQFFEAEELRASEQDKNAVSEVVVTECGVDKLVDNAKVIDIFK